MFHSQKAVYRFEHRHGHTKNVIVGSRESLRVLSALPPSDWILHCVLT